MHFRNPTSRSNQFKMLRGEGSKAAFTKREITRGARRILKTLTKEDEEEIEREESDESPRGRRRGESRVEESEHESNENVPMEEEESEEEEDELPMYQEHYDALFSMDFVETKYPHDDTMRALGIFEDVELVLKNMRLAKFFSYRLESYKELTCEFLASMRGERKVTFRQLEILWFHYGEGTHWDIKEDELQRVWATIAEEGYSSSRSKAAQIRSPVLRYVDDRICVWCERYEMRCGGMQQW
ncbi:unnamed protein product [Microthlaspi erraticum]|uniref:Arabidopsis retrotransposon Orf1 C-terminal domain-containing protein n=1 Tax=Microthlaspi erraticum TaxID=1685480 RepID=A0A6D2KDJ0_9BRAS|nr:unnamed protein product [Microthlaspi erraticum]